MAMMFRTELDSDMLRFSGRTQPWAHLPCFSRARVCPLCFPLERLKWSVFALRAKHTHLLFFFIFGLFFQNLKWWTSKYFVDIKKLLTSNSFWWQKLEKKVDVNLFFNDVKNCFDVKTFSDVSDSYGSWSGRFKSQYSRLRFQESKFFLTSNKFDVKNFLESFDVKNFFWR